LLRHPEACKGRPQGDISPRGRCRAVYRVGMPTYRRPWHRHGLYRIAAGQYIARCKAAYSPHCLRKRKKPAFGGLLLL
ncbi:MAG: hypothetical protein IKM08_03755, partial [Clostridia bacterium]|nr:hypothetical protein [Clostridia bacterium]